MSPLETVLPDSRLFGDEHIGNSFREEASLIILGELNFCSPFFCDAPAKDGEKTVDGVCFGSLPGKGRTCNLSRGTSA